MNQLVDAALEQQQDCSFDILVAEIVGAMLSTTLLKKSGGISHPLDFIRLLFLSI